MKQVIYNCNGCSNSSANQKGKILIAVNLTTTICEDCVKLCGETVKMKKGEAKND